MESEIIETTLAEVTTAAAKVAETTAEATGFGTALVHTVIGMGTVFIILILISLIISLFKFIPAIQAKFTKKEEAPKKVDAPPAPVEVIEEDETDELEIVAVITAAIAASMGTTNTDGFVVRSIRRRSGNRW